MTPYEVPCFMNGYGYTCSHSSLSRVCSAAHGSQWPFGCFGVQACKTYCEPGNKRASMEAAALSTADILASCEHTACDLFLQVHDTASIAEACSANHDCQQLLFIFLLLFCF